MQKRIKCLKCKGTGKVFRKVLMPKHYNGIVLGKFILRTIGTKIIQKNMLRR